MIYREPTMTIECTMCHDVFGAWRPRCPSCGSEADRGKREALLNKPRLVEGKKKPAREQSDMRELRPSKSACAFCQMRKAKESCNTCGARLHRYCIAPHVAREHGPNALENTKAISSHINNIIHGGQK